MEIAINPGMPTYSGGLGVLAGDTLRSAADLGVPLVAFTLLHRKGYFQQHLDASRRAERRGSALESGGFLHRGAGAVTVSVEDRIGDRARLALRPGGPLRARGPDLPAGHRSGRNSGWDRGLTDHLYGGDTNYRLQQEIVLGMGGVRMANALGTRVNVYHMNEGHAALLTLALLESQLGRRTARRGHRDRHRAGAQKCVFTTTRRFPPATTASPPSRPFAFSAATAPRAWKSWAVFATAC
jgi:glycogen phosphorylase